MGMVYCQPAKGESSLTSRPGTYRSYPICWKAIIRTERFSRRKISLAFLPNDVRFSALAEIPVQRWLLVMGVNHQRWKERASAA